MEDIKEDEKNQKEGQGKENPTIRRFFFAHSPHLIQSEVTLLPGTTGWTNS